MNGLQRGRALVLGAFKNERQWASGIFSVTTLRCALSLL